MALEAMSISVHAKITCRFRRQPHANPLSHDIVIVVAEVTRQFLRQPRANPRSPDIVLVVSRMLHQPGPPARQGSAKEKSQVRAAFAPKTPSHEKLVSTRARLQNDIPTNSTAG